MADTIQNRLSDPRIEPLTTVTRVTLSEDLSVAHIYLSVMGTEVRRRLTMAAIQRASGRIRSFVAQGVVLRHVPELVFHLDDSLQRAFQTVQTIDRAMAELEQRAASRAAEPPQEQPGGAAADEIAGEQDRRAEDR